MVESLDPVAENIILPPLPSRLPPPPRYHSGDTTENGPLQPAPFGVPSSKGPIQIFRPETELRLSGVRWGYCVYYSITDRGVLPGGTLTFTSARAAGVPEPATVLLRCGAVVLLWMCHRQKESPL